MKRQTIQRQLVFDSVSRLCDHPTAEDVYDEIYKTHPGISMGTVYRNLNALADENEIRRISISDSADRFDKVTYLHYHICCLKCDRFSDIDLPYMQNVDKLISESTGFELQNHDIVFKGVCPDCKEKYK